MSNNVTISDTSSKVSKFNNVPISEINFLKELADPTIGVNDNFTKPQKETGKVEDILADIRSVGIERTKNMMTTPDVNFNDSFIEVPHILMAPKNIYRKKKGRDAIMSSDIFTCSDNLYPDKQPVQQVLPSNKLHYLFKTSEKNNEDALSKSFHKYIDMIKRPIYKLRQIEKFKLQLDSLVKTKYKDYTVYITGSNATGCWSKSSDCDFCIVNTKSRFKSDYSHYVSQKRNMISFLKNIKKSLTPIIGSHPQLIPAKVPILKFEHKRIGISCDISTGCIVAPANTELLKTYVKIDPRFRELIIITKYWASVGGITEAFKGNLSSYSYSLLVLFFLQNVVDPPVLPNLHKLYPDILHINNIMFSSLDHVIDSNCSSNAESIGVLFKSFVKYYSNFKWYDMDIDIASGSLIKNTTTNSHDYRPIRIIEPYSKKNTAASLGENQFYKLIIYLQKTNKLFENNMIHSLDDFSLILNV